MDSYEVFMNEYVEFMKKYSANTIDKWFAEFTKKIPNNSQINTNTTLLKQYLSYLEKYSKFVEVFDKLWGEDDMNDAEIKYYPEVQSRVAKKLSEITL